MKPLFFLLPACTLILPLFAAPAATPPANPANIEQAAAAAAIVTPAPGAAAPAAPRPAANEPLPTAAAAAFERLPNGDIRIGQVTLHRQARKLSFPGKIQLDATQTPNLEMAGVLEVLIATEKGRLYEALLSSGAKPSDIQVMLILLGLNNGPRIPDVQGRQGDLVDIDVEWNREDGTLIEEPVENFLFDVRTKKHAARPGWTFVGTTMQGGVAGADAEGNIALSWSVGSTILDTADPEGEKSGIFTLNPEHVKPKAGTPVRIIITPRAKSAPPPARPPPPAKK